MQHSKKVLSDYLKDISEYNVRQAWPEPHRCALLVIDMQQYYLEIAAPILGNVEVVIEACRGKSMDVIFTRHGHRDLRTDGGMLVKWWGDGIMHGSKDWEIISAVRPLETEPVLDKTRYSAFCGSGLDERLKSRKIEEIIITGVMTNCCCETTARDGFMRDYRIFFVSDATAAINDELHLASLKNLAYGFAHVISTADLCRCLGRKA